MPPIHPHTRSLPLGPSALLPSLRLSSSFLHSRLSSVYLLFLAVLLLLHSCPSAVSQDCSFPLADSIPITERVPDFDTNKYFYYEVSDTSCAEPSTCQLTIVLTPIDNDVDLYALLIVDPSDPSDPIEPSMYCPKVEDTPDILWSENIGGDAIIIPAVTYESYYVIIAGSGGQFSASFTVLAELSSKRLGSNAVALYNGVGMYGAVTGQPGDQFWYYQIDVKAADSPQSLTVTLSIMYGQPVIYISNVDTVSNASFSATNAGSVNPYLSLPSASGPYFIAIHATQPAAFLTTAAYLPTEGDNTPVVSGSQRLRAGVPFPGTVSGATNQPAFFYLPYNPLSSSGASENAIVFTLDVTTLGGDADLFVSQDKEGSKYPDPNDDSTFFWKSELLYNDVVTIAPDDKYACSGECNYTVAVVPWGTGDTSFTLTADTQGIINLLDAVQVRDQVPVLQSHYYRYTPLPGVSSVTITVSPASGIVTVYIVTGTRGQAWPRPTEEDPFSNKTLSGVGELTVTVTPDDLWFCGLSSQTTSSGVASCSYYIAVYASTALNEQPAQFTITASSRSSSSPGSGTPSTQPVLLTNNVQSTIFSAPAGSYSYYYLTLVGPPTSLTLTATSITGDADLYYLYSETSLTQYPNQSHYTAAAESTSAVDIILVEPALPGYYWLAVNAFQNCTYRLSVNIYNESVLVDGVPLSAIVQQYSYKYYNFTITNTTARLTVSLFKAVGEPDLYIATPAFLSQRQILPNTSDYSYKSVTFYTDVVVVDNPPLGQYVIAVYGFETTLYTISASTSEAKRQLRESIGQSGTLNQGMSDYFSIAVDRINIALTVIVTVLSGDCDLYLSLVETQPGPDNFDTARKPIPDYLAAGYGYDGLTVPSKNLAPGQVWYAGVWAFTTCTYSISYKLGSTELLQDGRSQSGTVIKSTYRYYRFSITADQPYILTISATPTFGSVQLFVISSSTNTSFGQFVNGAQPDPGSSNYDLASLPYETSPVIVIQPDSPVYCSNPGVSNCTYWISVLGTSDGSEGANYTMVVRSNRTNTGAILQNGVTTDGYLAAGQYEYYRFNQDFAQGAVLFTLTPRDVQSDPDLFISCSDANTQPTAETADLISANLGGDAVHIDSTNDPDCWGGPWYVAVYAGSNRPAQYALLAQAYNATLQSSGITHVITNQQYTGLVTTTTAELQWRYFRYFPYYNGASSAAITITLTAIYGDPDMYLTDSSDVMPSADNNIAASTSISGGSIVIPAGTVCSTCSYTIGVTAYYASSLFRLMLTTAPQTIQLIAGQPYTSRVEDGGTRLFALSFVDRNDVLTITVTSLSGDADVYCSRYPNVSIEEDGAEWSSVFGGTDTISINNAVPATYYILVYGFYAAEFTIVATLGATQLIAGVPQHDFLAGTDFRLYAFNYGVRTGTPPPLTFSVTSTGGFRFVSLYVSDGTYPNSSSAQWSNVYNGVDNNNPDLNVLTISNVQSSHVYYLRVEAIYNLQYDVTAYYSGDNALATVLSASRFTVDSVQAGQCIQYIAYVSTSADGTLPDVSLDFIESIGDVQCNVGFNGPPTATVYNLTSSDNVNSRTGHVGVDTSQLGLTTNSAGLLTLYVAMCSVNGATYSLSYTTHAIYLPINQPLSARTPVDPSQPLYFFVQANVVGAGQLASLQLTILGSEVDGSQDAWGAQYTVYACNDQVLACRGVVQPNASAPFIGLLTNGGSWTLPQPGGFTTGTYVLAISSTPGDVSFVITMVQRTINTSVVLADQQRVTGQVLETSSIDYYQTQLQATAASTTTSVIQLDICRGEAQMWYSYKNPLPSSTNSDLGISSVPQQISPVSLTNTGWNGRLYFSVAPTAAVAELVYDVQVYSGPSPSLAYFDFSDRKVGMVQIGNGDVRVSVQSATVQSTVAAIGTVVQYVVYWTDVTDSTNFYTPCGCNLIANSSATSTSGAAFMAAPASLVPITITTVIPNLPSRITYKVNVAARLVQAGTESDPRAPASYEQVAAYASAPSTYNDGSADSGTMAAIAVPVVLCVVAALAYLVYRNRQLKQELAGVEMTDVPRGQVIKAAGGGGFRARAAAKLSRATNGAGRSKSKYSQLLGMGGGPTNDETGGREVSTNELGLDEDEEDVDVGMEDGVYNSGENGHVHGEDEEKHYTLDTAVDDLEHDENHREDPLGFRV